MLAKPCARMAATAAGGRPSFGRSFSNLKRMVGSLGAWLKRKEVKKNANADTHSAFTSASSAEDAGPCAGLTRTGEEETCGCVGEPSAPLSFLPFSRPNMACGACTRLRNTKSCCENRRASNRSQYSKELGILCSSNSEQHFHRKLCEGS